MKTTMQLVMLLVVGSVLAGCSALEQEAGSEPSLEPTAADTAPVAASGVEVWVEGPGVGPGRCAIDWMYMYQASTPAHVLLADTEVYSLETGKFVTGLTGLRIDVPAEDADTTAFGELVKIPGSTLNMPCDALRAEFLVSDCVQGECPDYIKYRYPHGEEEYVPVVIRSR